MKRRKNLEKAIVMGLLLSTSVYGTAWAEDNDIYYRGPATQSGDSNAGTLPSGNIGNIDIQMSIIENKWNNLDTSAALVLKDGKSHDVLGDVHIVNTIDTPSDSSLGMANNDALQVINGTKVNIENQNVYIASLGGSGEKERTLLGQRITARKKSTALSVGIDENNSINISGDNVKIIGNIDSFYEPVNSLEDLIKLVKSINEIFKDFVENKGINKTFHLRGKPLEEFHVQSAYFIIAELKCRDVDVDLSRESNNGRGPVDFKMSKGHEAKVVVEVKLTSNSRIKNGLRKQLPEYMKAENAKHGFYLVVDLNNSGFTKIEKEFSIFEGECDNIELCLVDGNIKPSASKL